MNKLEKLKSMGFKISWKLICIGLYGSNEIPAELTRKELFEFLIDSLISVNEKTDDVVALICEQDDDLSTDRLIHQYANREDTSDVIQRRKWRAYLLMCLLENISKDYLQGLLELMEFWVDMGIPKECPQCFPSNEGGMSPEKYFTQSTYDFLISRNSAWLVEEVREIIKSENCLNSLIE